MDFDEWQRSQEKEEAYEDLYKTVGDTVKRAYGDIVPCPNCGKMTNTFKGYGSKCVCQHCDHTWYV